MLKSFYQKFLLLFRQITLILIIKTHIHSDLKNLLDSFQYCFGKRITRGKYGLFPFRKSI